MDPSTGLEVAPHDGLEVVNEPGLHQITECTGYAELNHKLYPADGGPPKKKICGLSRAVFWLAVAMAALGALVVGLGIGLGVALSNRAQSVNTSIGANTTPLPSPPQLNVTVTISQTLTSPTSAPSTSTPSTPTSTDDIQLLDTVCPSKNDSLVRTSLGDIRYRVACDSDFGESGKQTLASFITATWDDCVHLCNTMNYFQNRADVGCTWNAAGTGQQTPGTCWCLGGVGKIVVSNKGNVAGVPQ